MLPPTCVWDVVFRHGTYVPDSRFLFVEQRNPVSIHGELFPHTGTSAPVFVDQDQVRVAS